MDQRLAGAQRHAPERERHAVAGERRLHEIGLADGGAAERHEHVGAGLARLRDRRSSASGVSLAMPRSIGSAPARAAIAATAKGFEATIWSGPAGLARRHELVAGGEDRDARAPPHREVGVAGGGGERDEAGVEPLSGRDEHVALPEIEPGGADVLARRDLRPDDHVVAVAVGVLLDRRRRRRPPGPARR